jgi:hypothetical protein
LLANAMPWNIVPALPQNRTGRAKSSSRHRTAANACQQESPQGGIDSMKITTALFAAFVATLTASSAAHASSDGAWAKFQTDVSKACVTAAKGLIEKGKTVVDPYGSEHYGMAVVTGKAVGAKARISTICVYDKQKKTAEIGGEISAEKLAVKP